jgi:acetamidase/formamidase
VLRIASGDIIDVSTLLTNSPTGLARGGRAGRENRVVTEGRHPGVSSRQRGTRPGGHILTGPVFVEGAMPGDVLEVKILSIDLPIDYGYNGCSGFVPANCGPRNERTKIFTLDRTRMTSEFMPGIVIPLKPFFGSMGVAPAPEAGSREQQPAGQTRRQSRQSRAHRGLHALHSDLRSGRALRGRRRTRGAG